MVDDGWCPDCETTTYGNCIHLNDGTTFPDPVSTIRTLERELDDAKNILRNLDRWIRTAPEYCPICAAQFWKAEDHTDECPLAGLTIEPGSE